ncbi:Rrf2 family transcriptional regulator [Desulfovibrio sp. OttesenSCG-928-O18]|nr:Rrf2 family transcriptional regulator [Desulfovibrio sp. OttesenSCG-928-O18]
MSYPTRARYGLRLLVRLAIQDDARHLSMADIAQEEGVSVKYLEQIVTLLKPLGILQATRGAKGGYALVRDPAEIYLDKVFASLGALDDPVPCFDDPTICARVDICTTRPFWMQLDHRMRDYLSGTSLADVVAIAPQGGAEFDPEFSREARAVGCDKGLGCAAPVK